MLEQLRHFLLVSPVGVCQWRTHQNQNICPFQSKFFFGFLRSGKSHWNGWMSFHSSSCLHLEQPALQIKGEHILPLYTIDYFSLQKNPKILLLEILKLFTKQEFCLGVPGTKSTNKFIIKESISSSYIQGCSPSKF